MISNQLQNFSHRPPEWRPVGEAYEFQKNSWLKLEESVESQILKILQIFFYWEIIMAVLGSIHWPGITGLELF